MFRIEKHTWEKGSPVHEDWFNPATRQHGLDLLEGIGRSGTYDVNFCFWLMENDRRIAILHIYPDRTYRIEED